ncbi:hypothetical protein DCAR_0727000 [Daucus carota subsp. sativus]|uniref:CASP-like protein n=1 Tax=Daucus carota subsp. sativus TaxID=79200 RepID=A0A164SNZ3_DAUCS|nr:PREDICTED: CASP-like protein 4D1 [Daucus carota subsp. sativus]WOH07568.1 hypothetical protein DCAR_0727000 [Daucus carota subsp. sativus]
MGDLQYEEPKASKAPLLSLASRVVTAASLAASIIILKSAKVTFKIGGDKYQYSYNDSSTYQYVLLSMLVAFAYNLLQIPSAIYHLKTGKRLTNRYGFLLFDLYGDKLGVLLLATSTGAAFGATLEIKRSADNLETIGGQDASDYRSKLGDFSSMAYLSAGLLLIAFISSTLSSIISSLALSRK